MPPLEALVSANVSRLLFVFSSLTRRNGDVLTASNNYQLFDHQSDAVSSCFDCMNGFDSYILSVCQL